MINIPIILVCISSSLINAMPIETNNNTNTNSEKEVDPANIDYKILDENSIGDSRAGIIDNLNPFNKPTETSESNKADGGNNNQNSNNPLQPIQSLLNNRPQILGGSNILEQLLSSNNSGGNFLDSIKIFLVGSQGMVMPASAVLGGFQNMMQILGNAGNLMPTLPSLLPQT